jgi:excisionase family DNA binding protein
MKMTETWLLTVKELTQRLHVGRDKAYALMHASGFPAIKIGGRYYVDERALRTWIDKQANKVFKL